MKTSIDDLYSIIRQLKLAKRKGWEERKLKADSIAEHTYGAVVVGWYIADIEGADTDKVIKMLVVHDLVMAEIKDVTPRSREYDQKGEMENEAKNIIAQVMSEKMRMGYIELFNEFNEGKTKESIVAREADKIETLLQGKAFEEETGRNDIVDGEFFSNYSKYIKTETGKKLFEEINLRSKGTKK